MATYVNNLRLKEIATGAESGTWGTSTNTNLELITDAMGYGAKVMAADSNETFTMADGTTDSLRAMFIKVTSGVTLTSTRTITFAPNTLNKLWWVENATSGSQSIVVKQGSGAEVTIPTGKTKVIYTDGGNATAAVTDALTNVNLGPSGTVTSVGGTGTVNGITLTGTVTSSGNLTLGGTLANVNLTSQVTGTLPVANGGTGSTSTTYVDLTANVTGTLPVANGGTGITSFGAGVADWLGTPSSANLATAVSDETGSGALVFATSPTFVTPVLGTPASGTLSSCTVDGTDEVGFRNVPQNSQSAAYTLVLADAGKHIFHPVADNTARTFTIPANASVAYPVGTAITFINMAVADVTIAITSDTLTLSDAGTTGSRTLATNGSATCIKITSTEWLISGSGVT